MSALTEPLLQARNIVQEFPVRGAGGLRGGVVHAVSDVSFDVHTGETLGIVGETGSGKSTLARSLVQAPRPKSGEVLFQGSDLVRLRRKRLVAARRHVQMVYQDPFGSLNPRWRVTELVEEPLLGYGVKGAERRRRRVRELLDLVGLDPSVFGGRRPRELSGGQCQRVAIARAIALDPALVICDEAVSSLDVLIQAQVLNLFERLRSELGLSYLFIAHDLALVKQVSDRVAVMHLGQLAEIGPADALYRGPLHPYTAALPASTRPPGAPAGPCRCAVSRPRRSIRRAAAGSALAARAPRTGARWRNRRCRSARRDTAWRATSRWTLPSRTAGNRDI
jgi:ABC-type glutathione transport system ATPase component